MCSAVRSASLLQLCCCSSYPTHCGVCSGPCDSLLALLVPSPAKNPSYPSLLQHTRTLPKPRSVHSSALAAFKFHTIKLGASLSAQSVSSHTIYRIQEIPHAPSHSHLNILSFYREFGFTFTVDSFSQWIYFHSDLINEKKPGEYFSLII